MTTSAMRKRKRRQRGDDYYHRHVRLHYWVMRSAAWVSLNPTARALLVHLYSLYNGMNNGELFLSVRHAAKALNIAPNTASKALRDLLDRGFIRTNQPGTFHLKTRHATTWILTEFGFRDDLPTRDFMRWKAGEKQKPASESDADGIKLCDRSGVRTAV